MYKCFNNAYINMLIWLCILPNFRLLISYGNLALNRKNRGNVAFSFFTVAKTNINLLQHSTFYGCKTNINFYATLQLFVLIFS